VKKWERDHRLHLTINPYYWDKKAMSLQEVFITMFKDIRVVSAMFNQEELDWIGAPFTYLSSQDISTHQIKAPLQVNKVDRIYWICLNTLSFPLQSAKIRKALAAAINRKEIIHELFNDYLPLLSHIPDLKSNKRIPFDGNISLAQQLFQEGLQELHLTQETFPPITLNYSDVFGQTPVAKMVKQQIEFALKITVNLVETHWNTLSNLIDKKEYQLAGYVKSATYFYPSFQLKVFQEPLYPTSTLAWENHDYSLLLQETYKTSDPIARDRLQKRTEEILIDEMPGIPVFQQVYKYFLHPKIKRNVVHKNGDLDLKLILL
jgi:oligopeptide transport system substrate-binding protein